jgi:hypothetical protein
VCLEAWGSVYHLLEFVLGQGRLVYVLQLTQHALHSRVLELGDLKQAGPGAKVCHELGPLHLLLQLERELPNLLQ